MRNCPVFVVIRDRYGALSLPLGIWWYPGDAIDQAIGFAQAAADDDIDFRHTPRNDQKLGHAKAGSTAWLVYRYQMDMGRDGPAERRPPG